MNNLCNNVIAICTIFITGVILWSIISDLRKPTPLPQPQIVNTEPKYPLEMAVSVNLGKTDLVTVTHKVYYLETEKVYVYSYKLTYSGTEKALFCWELLSKLQNSSEPLLLEFQPKEIKELIFKSPLEPTLAQGEVGIYQSGTDEMKFLKRHSLGNHSGPAPKK